MKNMNIRVLRSSSVCWWFSQFFQTNRAQRRATALIETNALNRQEGNQSKQLRRFAQIWDDRVRRGKSFISNAVSTAYKRLTCAVKSIADVSWIALTPVAAGRVTDTHVRCYLSTVGILMTYARCARGTLSRICIIICKYWQISTSEYNFSSFIHNVIYIVLHNQWRPSIAVFLGGGPSSSAEEYPWPDCHNLTVNASDVVEKSNNSIISQKQLHKCI